jgi:hypothetical protein
MEKMKKHMWLSVFTLLVSACCQASTPVVMTSQVTNLTTVEVIRLPTVEDTPVATATATGLNLAETPTVTILKTPYSKFVFYCTSNPDLFMADIAFEIPIEDTFELYFDDMVYPCSIDPHYSNLMHCYGDRVRENQPVKLNLRDMTSQQDIASFEAKTPICIIEPVVSVRGECGRHKTRTECLVQSDICHWIGDGETDGSCRHIHQP